MRIGAHPRCGTRDIGVQRSGKFTDEQDKRKGTHKALPTSIISFNSSEDIEGKKEFFLMKQPSVASCFKGGSRVSSARVERVNMFHPRHSGEAIHFVSRQG